MQKQIIQQGFALIKNIFWVLILLFFGTLAIRLIPIYYADLAVTKILQDAATKTSIVYQDEAAASFELKKLLYKQFSINYISDVNVENVKIVRSSTGISIELNYNVQVPLIANIDALIHFNNKAQVKQSEPIG
jgi:hypothetical protein